jgi:hypothetical protein
MQEDKILDLIYPTHNTNEIKKFLIEPDLKVVFYAADDFTDFVAVPTELKVLTVKDEKSGENVNRLHIFCDSAIYNDRNDRKTSDEGIKRVFSDANTFKSSTIIDCLNNITEDRMQITASTKEGNILFFVKRMNICSYDVLDDLKFLLLVGTF